MLTDGLRAGGKERRLVELVKGFKKYPEIDLHLVVFSEEIHFQEIYTLGISVSILKRVPKRSPKVFYEFYKLCKEWKPDLIHSWGTMSTIIAIPASVVLGVKIINGNIANAPDDMRFFDSRLIRAKFTFPFSKVIVSNSLAGLKVYSVPKEKGVCIYNGFDVNRTLELKSKTLIREEFKITTDKVVGMVGGFHGKKDYATYIEAALLLFERRNDVTFMAIGGGPELPKFKAMIPSKYVGRFIFTDIQKDVESIVNVFDVGVLSTYTEGISNAILEYMALAKPTVASIGGGTPETVEDQKTGYLVPTSSPEIMAKQLNYLLDNPDVIKVMGAESKERLVNVFGLETMTKSFYDLYTKALSR